MHDFPIHTATSCKLKWAWSTLVLNVGLTRSCHRTAVSELTKENFADFHNTPVKLQDRQSMLAGQWPDNNCGYCRNIEATGGVSDRMRQQTLPYRVPVELIQNPKATVVSPTLVEVYFNNTCNLACLYCNAGLSSRIAAENLHHGVFQKYGVKIDVPDMHFKDLIGEFWKWFPYGFPTLARLNVLGGEPLFQPEFDTLLDMIQQYPNSDCELNIVTNLMVSSERFNGYINKLRDLVNHGKLKRIDITCSIDCWGPEQEYVRWGLNLEQWEKNFSALLTVPDFYLNINQTISPLTIKTMPELLEKLSQWRQQHQVGHWFSAVEPGPVYLKPGILGRAVFEKDIDRILDVMPRDTDEDQMAHSYMSGILNSLPDHPDADRARDMFVYLEEKDRRRGTSWREIFPWLKEFEHYVV